MIPSDELLTGFKELLPFITATGAVLSAASLVPRIGPGRALWIAMRSRFASKPVPESLRSSEIKLLKRRLSKKDDRQGYLVVTGEKGVGKSCLISTLMSKTPGVINVKVPAKQDEQTIVHSTLKKLTEPPFKFMDPMKTAPRVIFWHRFFTLGRSPIVVLQASERKRGQEYADLTGAVRSLVETYNLRVIVDGSPNSLDESLLGTTRERVFDIKPMAREMIWKIDQLKELFNYVDGAHLGDVVFAVLGGIPARYVKMWAETDFEDGQTPRQVIGTHLCAQIYVAINRVKDSKTKTNDMEEIIKLFDKDKNYIRSDTLTVKKLDRPTPDKVFREVKKDGIPVLIPASNAIGIVLKYGLTKEPSLDELEALIKTKI